MARQTIAHAGPPVEPFLGRYGELIAPGPTVDTTAGPIKGRIVDGLHTFLGVRYAEAPVGELRFRPPVPSRRMSRVQSAVGYGPPAMQGVDAEIYAPRNDFLIAHEINGGPLTNSKLENEDCLYLNVYSPGVDDAKRPVVVWLHGGGFAYGAGSDSLAELDNLARRGDIVGVSLNHRLNLFGFMDLSEFDPTFSGDGDANVGMQDIVLALTWVRDNIAAFGGDPNQVTIGGQSGGGGKVSHLMGMPSARGLFQRAIVQSGPGLRAIDRDTARQNTQRILDSVGLEPGDVAGLQAIPGKVLRDQAVEAFKATVDKREVRYRTILQMGVDMAAALRTFVDGTIMPAHPFEPEATALAADVPLLTGWVKDEWTYMLAEADPGFIDASEDEVRAALPGMYRGFGPELYEMAKRHYPHYAPGHLASVLSGSDISYRTMTLADRKSRQPAPVYAYALKWETPVNGGILRTPHVLDLSLALDLVDRQRGFVGPGSEPQVMADQMSEAWIAFIRTGDPNTQALSEWPAYHESSRLTMMFDLESRVESDPLGDIHDLFRREQL